MFLSLLAKEAELTAFANLLSNDPINLVVNQNLIKDTDGLHSLSLKEKLLLLKGKTIGVASGPVSRLNKLFEVANIKADSLFQIKIISGKQQNQAFAKGQVDALYAHTPYLEKAITENNALILINQSAGEVPEMANRHIHLMVAQKNFIKNNPETISKICKAIYKAQMLIHSDKQAAVNAIRKSEIRLQAPNALEILFDIYEPAVPQNPEVFGEILTKELDLFPTSRETPQLDSLAIAKSVDNTFAQKAVQSLKMKQ
jgi:ABC-type nitrate/sulfonate/bicarbonate transport system substrate-binding protein